MSAIEFQIASWLVIMWDSVYNNCELSTVIVIVICLQRITTMRTIDYLFMRSRKLAIVSRSHVEQIFYLDTHFINKI